jgi:hypothetical protein
MKHRQHDDSKVFDNVEDEEREVSSTAAWRQHRFPDFLQRYYVLWVCFVIRKPILELSTLGIGQRYGRFIEALPNLLDERQALLGAEPIDAELLHDF